MTVRADISPGFLGRIALVAAIAFGFAGWSLYDGMIGYPQQRMRALEYRKLKKAGRLEEWEPLAKERGWPPGNPGKPHDEADYETQFVMASIAGAAGLLFLIHFLRNRGRWIEADETGLRTSRKEQAAFTDIVTLDKKKWRKKGIAVVNYQADGRKRRITLDDCNYQQVPTTEILRAVEAHLAPEQIINGRPEPPLEQAAEAEEGSAEESTPAESTPAQAPATEE